jgi:hypothetical protein
MGRSRRGPDHRSDHTSSLLTDLTSTYHDGARAGWSKVKDGSWYACEAWQFDRR